MIESIQQLQQRLKALLTRQGQRLKRLQEISEEIDTLKVAQMQEDIKKQQSYE